jgi:hypothetical protein
MGRGTADDGGAVAIDDTGDAADDRFSFSERTVAYSALIVALLACVGLVISLVSKHSDRLATIALVLAAVAFVLQLGFFVIQLWVAQEQDRRSRETYTRTLGLLTRIETRSDETTDVIKEQFRFVLEKSFALRGLLTPPNSDAAQVVGESDEVDVIHDDRTGSGDAEQGGESDPIEAHREVEAVAIADLVVKQLDEIARRDVIRQWEELSTANAQRAGPSSLDARKARNFHGWPSEEAGKEAINHWSQLSEPAQRTFRSLVSVIDQHVRRSQRYPRGVRYPTQDESRLSALRELEQKGLAHIDWIRGSDGRFLPRVRLSSLGFDLGKLFAATDPAPDWLVGSGHLSDFERPRVKLPPLPPAPIVEE